MSAGCRVRQSCVPASRAAGRPATASQITLLPAGLALPPDLAGGAAAAAASLGQKASSRRGGGPCAAAAAAVPAATVLPVPSDSAAAAPACWSSSPLDSEDNIGD